jgi:hypothetical protein
VGGEAGLLLIEVEGEQVEAHRRALAHVEQQVEHRVAVLAAGQADQHAVAVLDHREVFNGLAHLAQQARLDPALDKHPNSVPLSSSSSLRAARPLPPTPSTPTPSARATHF